jgi:hypothetical protein
VKSLLLHPDHDLDPDAPPPWNAEDLLTDLDLAPVLDAMADGDDFLAAAARRGLLLGTADPAVIAHRQHVLADCLAHPETVRELYDLAERAVAEEAHSFWGFFTSPDSVLSRSTGVMRMFTDALRRLRALADEHAAGFGSEGFGRLFATVQEELDDAFFEEVAAHLRDLSFRHGVLISAALGPANQGTGYVLRRAPDPGLRQRLGLGGGPGLSFEIAARDEAGARDLGDLRGRGVNLVANALAQSNDHILAFFTTLRAELAFYLGAVNLHDRLCAAGVPVCLPTVSAPGTGTLHARGLYDPALALRTGAREGAAGEAGPGAAGPGTAGAVVGNDLPADGCRLVVVTGANQGGKTTFLRAVGAAHLLAACGLFVPAEECALDAVPAVATHFKRDEDAELRGGRLDEELGRMSAIVDHLTPHTLLLSNESFSATNEREGSEIARQILRALLEAEVRVALVTHLYDLAGGLWEHRDDTVLFLRAERGEGARGRSYRLPVGEPLPTSYGADSYRKVFGAPPGEGTDAGSSAPGAWRYPGA